MSKECIHFFGATLYVTCTAGNGTEDSGQHRQVSPYEQSGVVQTCSSADIYLVRELAQCLTAVR